MVRPVHYGCGGGREASEEASGTGTGSEEARRRGGEEARSRDSAQESAPRSLDESHRAHTHAADGAPTQEAPESKGLIRGNQSVPG